MSQEEKNIAYTVIAVIGAAAWLYCREIRIRSTGTPSLWPHGSPFSGSYGRPVDYGYSTSFPVGTVTGVVLASQ